MPRMAPRVPVICPKCNGEVRICGNCAVCQVCFEAITVTDGVARVAEEDFHGEGGGWFKSWNGFYVAFSQTTKPCDWTMPPTDACCVCGAHAARTDKFKVTWVRAILSAGLSVQTLSDSKKYAIGYCGECKKGMLANYPGGGTFRAIKDEECGVLIRSARYFREFFLRNGIVGKNRSAPCPKCGFKYHWNGHKCGHCGHEATDE